jgi:hypothetical protein
MFAVATVVVFAAHIVGAASPGIAGVDAEREVILVDEAAGLPHKSHGAFSASPRGFQLTTGADVGDAFALWSTPTFADGLVRARFVVGSKLRSDILVRAVADTRRGVSPDRTDSADSTDSADVDVLDELDGGYTIALERDLIRLGRVEHRMNRLLGVEEKISPPLKPGSVVEVVVVAVGPWLQATVYDSGFRRLAHVAVMDRGFQSGGVGVRMSRYQDATSALSFLSVATSRPPSSSAPDLTMDGAGTGAGVERLVSISTDDLRRLPPALKSSVTTQADGVTFLATDPIGVELLERARIPLKSHRTQMPFLHVDSGLRKTLGKPPTKTSRGFRVDESYKDDAMVEALLRAYAEKFPDLVHLEEIGRSREGRAIWAMLITKGADPTSSKPAVLFDGAHHGGELISTEFVLDIVQQLIERYGKDKEITTFVNDVAIWCVPLVNVDGNHRYIHETRDYDRKNARDIDDNGRLDGWDGVDLYRQYPVRWGGLGEVGSRSWPYHYRYRGPEAGSEPEIQAMMRLAARERFVASIDYHTNATKILVPYTDPSLKNPDDNEAWAVAERIAATLPSQINSKRYEVQRNLYPVDGTAQDYFRFQHGTVALLVEAPQHNPLPYDRRRNGNVVLGRNTWMELLRAVVAGPAIAVSVVDDSGAPVEAAVTVVEHAPQMGERWTSRPRDGLAYRLVSKPGPHTVVVEYVPGDGAKPIRQRRTIEVGPEAGVVGVKVKLPTSG